MQRRLAIVALFIAITGSVFLWWWLHRPTDRQLIDELIARAVQGVETKSLDEIMDCVSPDYRDELGLSRVDVWRGAAHFVQSPDRADVSIDDYALDIAAPIATGIFDVRVVITQNGQYLDMGPLHMTVQFEKQRRRLKTVWLVKSVNAQAINKLIQDYM